MKTLYDLIGARRDDDAERLKKAYRNAVKAAHPDYHADDPGAARRFVLITAAYEILRDPKRRAAYDRILDGGGVPPTATSGHTAAPRWRFFVSYISISSAVTVTLGGAVLLLFARASGVSIEDVFGRRAPPPSASAAVQTAAPPMPVPAPGGAPSTAQDGSASAQTKDRTAAQETKHGTALTETPNPAASANTAPAIQVVKPEVTTGPVDPASAPQRHDDVLSYGPWLAGRDPRSDTRTDVRTRDPAVAEPLSPVTKPAPRPGTVIESERQVPVACRRWKVAADHNGAMVPQCADKTAHAADDNVEKHASRSGGTQRQSKPDAFIWGPICLTFTAKACPPDEHPR